MDATSSSARQFGYPYPRPTRRVRRAGPARLPDSRPRRLRIRCHVPVAICARITLAEHTQPGDQACPRAADSWCGSTEPRFAASAPRHRPRQRQAAVTSVAHVGLGSSSFVRIECRSVPRGDAADRKSPDLRRNSTADSQRYEWQSQSSLAADKFEITIPTTPNANPYPAGQPLKRGALQR
ncbi:MAG: hypothetical protein QOK23_4238 [Gammaproteobacteria bacterium]|nr:hypothetical protein [Gammaproteobacteria bacterium]